MKASVSYNDLIGTAAADISDLTTRSNTLEELAANFGINQERYKVVGLSLFNGTGDFYFSFICEDKLNSNESAPAIVKILIDNQEVNFNSFFKRFEVILYGKHDTYYPSISGYKEVCLSDL